VYELGVAPAARLQGVATELVRELAALARERGCYGMWVGTEPDNEAAQATYRRAGATEEAPFVLLNWDLTADGETAGQDGTASPRQRAGRSDAGQT
jgi:RimJ/RimL family protein N-acetyltransferase